MDNNNLQKDLKMPDQDFFERAVASDKIKIEEDSIPSLVTNYKKNISNSEDFVLNFISSQPVPVLNPYRKIDSPGKLNKYINTIKSKKFFEDDMASSAVNLVGITDLLVCSLLNDSLISIFQKPKDKAKIKYYVSLVQASWHRFLQSNISGFGVETIKCLRHFLFKWNDMLKETEHSKIFTNVTFTANEKYKSLKNFKDKNTSTTTKPEETEEKKKVDVPKPKPLKRHHDESVKPEIPKTEVISSPVAKKPKIDIRNYFSMKKDDLKGVDDDNQAASPIDKTDDVNLTENNNKILQEKLNCQITSPTKQIEKYEDLVDNNNKTDSLVPSPSEKENKMDIEIIKENKINNLLNEEKKSDLVKTPPKINAFQRLMESAKKRKL